MLTRQNSLCLLGGWLDACALWRLYLPYLNLPGSSFFIFAQKPDWTKIAGADIVVTQRCCTQQQYEFLATCRGLGMTVVYDLDDQVFDIPEKNPAAAVLHRYRDGFKQCMSIVDIITVSTRTLAKVVRRNISHPHNRITGKEIPVLVVENRLDERWFSQPAQPDDKLIVGWAGSSSHVEDLEIVQDTLKATALEYPGVLFQFRGMHPPETLRELPNVTHELWTPVPEYGARMPQWGWSIALAPLTDCEFNNAKSSLKIVESAHCSIPCLASWQRPYDEFCSYDPELRWLLCAGQSSWASKLRVLINEPARRKELGSRMNKVMHEHYSWSKTHEGWTEVLSTARSL